MKEPPKTQVEKVDKSAYFFGVVNFKVGIVDPGNIPTIQFQVVDPATGKLAGTHRFAIVEIGMLKALRDAIDVAILDWVSHQPTNPHNEKSKH